MMMMMMMTMLRCYVRYVRYTKKQNIYPPHTYLLVFRAQLSVLIVHVLFFGTHLVQFFGYNSVEMSMGEMDFLFS